MKKDQDNEKFEAGALIRNKSYLLFQNKWITSSRLQIIKSFYFIYYMKMKENKQITNK